MTNEEWERLKDSIRAKEANASDETAKARRKMDRDLDRIERALNACVNSEAARHRRRVERKRWQEFDKRLKGRLAEGSAFATGSEQKLKALREDLDRKEQRPSTSN
jgi:hypothetical protein